MKKKLLSLVLLLHTLSSIAAGRLITGLVSGESHRPLAGVSVKIKNSTIAVTTDAGGKYRIEVPGNNAVLTFSFVGYKPKEVLVGKQSIINVSLQINPSPLSEVAVVGYGSMQKLRIAGRQVTSPAILPYSVLMPGSQQNTESYSASAENRFHTTRHDPLSTFGIDVDAASYSTIRRFINGGQLPPKNAVRIEEMINYFDYKYPQPEKKEPFSVNAEISKAPWNGKHLLAKIGLQGKVIPSQNLPPSNLVFLIDVSGSMDAPNKLPLLKSSLKMLTDQLRSKDRVSIVVYAGAAGLVLPATAGDKKQTIKEAIEQLQAGGSTAGGLGIQLAYKVAAEGFRKGGNNRVILATDGDFNVGMSSDAEMESLIEEKRKSGIFLTVLGFGMGNYKDSKMEVLADKGNGNYAYIDNISEARKVLVNEFGATLFTIACDVKLQIEFNPAKVQAYRLIGYENRLLAKEDFNRDEKDAGDLGSGHRVTALYELIPPGQEDRFVEKTDDLKYQTTMPDPTNTELLTVKLRYKEPGSQRSKLIEHAVTAPVLEFEKASPDFRFAAAVAAFGMLLKDSEFKQGCTYNNLFDWARSGIERDDEGYKSEFLRLVKSSALLVNAHLNTSAKKEND